MAHSIAAWILGRASPIHSAACHFSSRFIVQPDGKLLVAGFFDSYQGAPRFSLARLLANGALDTAFDIGTGFTSSSDPSTPAFLNGLVLQHDGQDHRHRRLRSR